MPSTTVPPHAHCCTSSTHSCRATAPPPLLGCICLHFTCAPLIAWAHYVLGQPAAPFYPDSCFTVVRRQTHRLWAVHLLHMPLTYPVPLLPTRRLIRISVRYIAFLNARFKPVCLAVTTQDRTLDAKRPCSFAPLRLQGVPYASYTLLPSRLRLVHALRRHRKHLDNACHNAASLSPPLPVQNSRCSCFRPPCSRRRIAYASTLSLTTFHCR